MISYFACGYLFLSVYRFALFLDGEAKEEFDHILLKSMASSFVILTLYHCVASMISPAFVTKQGSAYFLVLILISVLGGYGAARIIRHPRINDALYRLGIHRTVGGNIWDDVLMENMWVRVWRNDDSGRSYQGQIEFIEGFEREPILVLSRYQYLDVDGTVLVDYSDDMTFRMMLNTKNFERIEIVYPNRRQSADNIER